MRSLVPYVHLGVLCVCTSQVHLCMGGVQVCSVHLCPWECTISLTPAWTWACGAVSALPLLGCHSGGIYSPCTLNTSTECSSASA